MDSEPELKLMSLITQLYDLGCLMRGLRSCDSDLTREFIALSIQIISLVRSMDLESELMSLISQTINVFKSIDLDSQPKQLQDFIQLISEKISLPNSIDSYLEENSDFKLLLLIEEIVHLDPELISLISQILSLVISESERETKPQTELELASERETKPESEPQTELDLELVSLLYQLRHLGDTLDFSSDSGSISMYVSCMIQIISLVCSIDLMSLISQIISCFKSMDLDSQPKPLREFIQLISPEIYLLNNSTEPNSSFKASLEIKHPLHPKHTLQLALFRKTEIRTRECYCCDKELQEIFYYCSACDYAMNIVCVKKPPVLSIDRSKWHEHPLALFPRLTSLTCNLCALSHSRCPFYMCPPCNLVVHQSCINLPRVIRISRHPHRISFTSSFDQGDWSCGVCRRNIDNNYGGFACIKDSCSYAAHSKCATQNNVWDGVELENVPEEVEEEVIEPFVRISDGIIQHFRHQQHHLRLDMNTGRDYDQNKQCQACFTPIYFGNLYSCIQCDYILHEQCAELSRKIHHPIHPHLLTLVGGYNGDMITKRCSACYGLCIAEFFYSCGENGCDFQLHVPCATISEPLIHDSHTHPLYLTSKPGERRICWACKNAESCATKETFNCIEDCDFALCFLCATLPQKVRYKHDKHILTLCFGKEISTLTYWCEVCEGKIMSQERFYMCDEYCCVTIHIKCMLGEDLYMKPGSLWNHYNRKVSVMPNNHMSRPTCSNCEKHCPHKTVLEEHGLIFCGQHCLLAFISAMTK